MQKDRWRLIDRIADDLGVPYNTRLKWRQRGVAGAFRLKIAERARARYRVKLRDVDFGACAKPRPERKQSP